MPEMLKPAQQSWVLGLEKMWHLLLMVVSLVAHGFVVGHITPEAQDGGNCFSRRW